MRPLAALAALALIAASAGCAHPWGPIDRRTFPSPDRFPRASAAVLQSEARVRYFTEPSTGEAVAEITERTRIAVLQAGGEGLGPLQLPYTVPFSTVRSLRARVLERDGTERELDTSTALDHPLLESAVVYSGSRALTFELPSLPAGAVLEFEHVTRFRDLRLFRFDFVFGGQRPVLETRLEVSAPAEWEVEWLARRGGTAVVLPPVASTQNGEVRRVWEQRDLPGQDSEPASAGGGEQLLQVQTRLARFVDRGEAVRTPENPVALSESLHSMLPKPGPPAAPIVAITREVLVGADDDPVVKARWLYEWVSARVQYCALHVGYGGWVPHLPTQVLERRYGDCKDKAALLSAMLSAAGISSRLAAVYAHDGVPRPFGLASISGNFNHMILIIDLPGGPVFADPTARTVPFGTLPPDDQEADVLPLTTPGSSLLRTQLDPIEATQESLVLEAALDDSGRARGRVQLSATGALAAERQAVNISMEGKQRTLPIGRWLGLANSSAAKVKSQGAPFSNRFDVEAEVELQGVMRGSGDIRLVRVTDFSIDWLPVLHATTRASTFVVPVIGTRRARYQFQLPAGMTVGRLPSPVSIDGPLGTYVLTWESTGQTLIAERQLTMKTRRVPASDYPALKAFVDQMLAAEAAGAVLRYSTLVPAAGGSVR